MTRTLFFLTSLAAMLMALTAVLIRVELAYPGLSPLLEASHSTEPGLWFSKLATTHAIMGYLAVMALGTTLCSAARERGAPLANVFVGLGVLICAATFLIAALAALPALLVDLRPDTVGWVLYPPLSTSRTSLLAEVSGLLSADPLVFVRASQYLLLPAATLLYIGAYAMLATLPGIRWVGVAGPLITIVMVVVILPSIADQQFAYGTLAFVIAALPFLAASAIRLSDTPDDWLILLTLGLIATIAAQPVIESFSPTFARRGTMAAAAQLYIFPMGLAWYALPACILFSRGRRLPTGGIWAMTGAITVGLALWLVPLWRVGLNGMPTRYPDFAPAYAADNLTGSIAVGLFILIYLIVIVVARRSHRLQLSDQPGVGFQRKPVRHS